MGNSNSAHTPGKYRAGPAWHIDDAMLAAATKVIQDAIVEHCGTGADIWMVSAMAAQKIIGDIAQQSYHANPDGTFAEWKRMPPALRAAIAAATGSAK